MSRAFEDPIYDEVSGPILSIEAMAEVVAECKRLRAEIEARDAAIERLKTTLSEKDHEIAGLKRDLRDCSHACQKVGAEIEEAEAAVEQVLGANADWQTVAEAVRLIAADKERRCSRGAK